MRDYVVEMLWKVLDLCVILFYWKNMWLKWRERKKWEWELDKNGCQTGPYSTLESEFIALAETIKEVE